MHPDPVEVYGHWIDHPPDEKEWQSGSGYPLASHLVLTAAHIVCPGRQPLDEIRVRDATGALDAARVVWHDDVLDVALVEITDAQWPERGWRQPVRSGQLVTRRAGQECTASGFPRVVATPQMRGVHVATGRINPGGRVKAGLYAIDVDNPPAPPDEGGSRWAGMSGAAVLADGFLVGVVVQDPAGFDSRELLSVSILRVLAAAGFRGVVEQHCGHVVVEAVELAGVAERVRPPTSPAGLLRADVAPTRFRPRPELDQLIEWCQDPGWSSVRLVHGPGGQGKTRMARQLGQQVAGAGCGVPEVGPGSLTSGDRWSDMIPACRCGCCT